MANIKPLTLMEEFEDYNKLWDDSSAWVTASGTKINNSQTFYKEKLQKLVDFHIDATLAHDAKAHGRWKPTFDMQLKALDETPDSAFLTYSEKFYRGQDPNAKTKMIDAFYNKKTKKFKVRCFLDGKLAIKKEGDSFNNLMEELCFFFRGPKYGTSERQDLMEWVDANGNKVNTSTTANSKATPKTATAFGSFAPQYQKLIAYYRKHLTTNVVHCNTQALTLEFPGTGNQLKLHIIQDPQNNCLVCTLIDGSANDKVLAKSAYFKTWDEVLDWLLNYGLILPTDRSLLESIAPRCCKFDFTKEDLDVALDKLTEEDELGLRLGDNFEDTDVMTVAGEPYGGTTWYVDKWADNLYIITSELWGQDGGGPEEGVYEEFDSIDEVWDYLSKLAQLDAVPALRPEKT